MLQYIENSGGKHYPFTTEGKVLRVATVEDMNEQSRLESEKPTYIKAAKTAIRELDLPMKLVEVEPLLSQDCIIFYFTAESRVDFRELIRRLAKELKVRVELRQVGARDEARLIADYEKCGQHCCCKQFLKVLKPVPMRTAKVQKGTLDPQKISGRCGRLMCCLRYEDATYEELRRNLPPRKTRVRTEDGDGSVVSTQILTQLALVELDESGKQFAYPVEQIERLDGKRTEDPGEVKKKAHKEGAKKAKQAEREQKEQDAESSAPRRPKPGQPLREDEVESREGEASGTVEDETASPMAPTDTEKEDKPAPGKGKPKSRKRSSKPRGSSSGGSPKAENGGEGQGGGPPKKKRRRRRRRRSGGGPNDQN
jgi:cell fate regulator YaaT (PSP1 superfamily)